MGLIKCPECGKEYSDKANACPNCACPIEEALASYEPKSYKDKFDNQQAKNSHGPIEEIIRKKAASTEKKELKQQNRYGNVISGWICIVLAIVCFLTGIWFGGIFFGLVGAYTLIAISNNKRRIRDLEKLEEGQRKIIICPFCKSTNVSSNLVQAGARQDPTKYRVAKNINPFHPFTHTNIHASGVNTRYSYDNVYQCNDCGKVFNRAEEMWDAEIFDD